MAEVEAQLKAGMGMDAVSWLTSPELAIACRTGFAPGDRASIVDALAAAGRGEGVNAEVPWALAGPSGAEAAVRHYSHDAWNSVSATIKLPDKGAVIGALGPVLAPTTPGERRALVVAFPILARSRASRAAASSEWAADMGQALRDRAGVKQTTRLRDEAHRVRRREAKLSRGSALTRPYAVCTVTVAKTARIAEYGRLLDASIRRAGFAPLRLDVGQDVGLRRVGDPAGRQPHPQGGRVRSPRGRGVAGLLSDFGHDLPAVAPAAAVPKPARLFRHVGARGLREPDRGWVAAAPAGGGLPDDLRPGPGAVAVHRRPRAASDRRPDGHRRAVRRRVLRRPGRLGAARRDPGDQRQRHHDGQAGHREVRHHQGVRAADDRLRLPHPGSRRSQGRVRAPVPLLRGDAHRARTRACRRGSTRSPSVRSGRAGTG